MPNTGIEFKNLRGVRRLMLATMLTDTTTEMIHNTPVRFAGVRSVGGEAEESSSSEFYDNQANIVVSAEGSDKYPIVTSVLEDKIKAIVEGRMYDEETGAYYGTKLERPYNAVGFVAEDTSGQEYYYWIYKGKFTGGKEAHDTKTDGTDSTNLEWELTSIYSNKEFETPDGKKTMKFFKLKAGGKVTEDQFFDKVFYPEDLKTTAQAQLKAEVKTPTKKNKALF